MKQTFFEKWRHRFGAAWDVFTGHAWAGYGNPLHYKYIGESEADTLVRMLNEITTETSVKG